MGSDHALKYASWYGCFYRPDFAFKRNSYICGINIYLKMLKNMTYIYEIILGAEYLILTVLPNVVHLMRILSEFKPFKEGGISSGESYFQN